MSGADSVSLPEATPGSLQTSKAAHFVLVTWRRSYLSARSILLLIGKILMCLFAAGLGIFAEFPLLVVANREESLRRPTAGPQRHDSPGSHHKWLGGQDLRAGGTWLGVNTAGLLAAITNRRRSVVAHEPHSRGLLCREILEQAGDLDEVVALVDREMRQRSFDGFNLLLFQHGRGTVIEAGDVTVRRDLLPGLHVITNGDTDDPADERIRAVQSALADITTPEEWLSTARQLAGSHGRTDVAAPICLHRGDRGTVSSTIVAIGAQPGPSIYQHAAGPPCQTPYEDYSPSLESLLATRRP